MLIQSEEQLQPNAIGLGVAYNLIDSETFRTEQSDDFRYALNRQLCLIAVRKRKDIFRSMAPDKISDDFPGYASWVTHFEIHPIDVTGVIQWRPYFRCFVGRFGISAFQAALQLKIGSNPLKAPT